MITIAFLLFWLLVHLLKIAPWQLEQSDTRDFSYGIVLMLTIFSIGITLCRWVIFPILDILAQHPRYLF